MKISTGWGMILFRTTGLMIVILLAIYLADFVQDNDFVQMLGAKYGYAGVFAIAVLTGFNLAVPIPAISFLPLFLAINLNYLNVIILLTLGMTLADTIAYYIGKVGQQIAAESLEKKVLEKFTYFKEKYKIAPMVLVFLFASFAPVPNEVILIPLGFLGYRLIKIIPAILAGNFVFNTLYSLGLLYIVN